jgi:hypothetical protein
MNLPSFYTVIPAFVRYNTDLTDFDKLMYGEISALTNANNYCWASNKYFTFVFNKSERTIKYSIKRLVASGVITSRVNAKDGNTRFLTLSTPMDKSGPTPMDKSGASRARPKYRTNNTRYNTFDTKVGWFDDYLKELQEPKTK